MYFFYSTLIVMKMTIAMTLRLCLHLYAGFQNVLLLHVFRNNMTV